MRGIALAILFLASPVAAHDHYSDWKTSDGRSCCSDRDCFPAVWAFGEDGLPCVKMPDGQCIPVPHDREIPVNHPDGRAHICARQVSEGLPWYVLCWTPGKGT
jgi:hypothetical protein